MVALLSAPSPRTYVRREKKDGGRAPHDSPGRIWRAHAPGCLKIESEREVGVARYAFARKPSSRSMLSFQPTLKPPAIAASLSAAVCSSE